MSMKRRDALKALGGLVGAAGAAKLLSACGSDDDGGEVGITTFVYMMMENRSYDHYLGARALDGLGGDGITAGLTYKDVNGADVPVYAASADFSEQCVSADPPHGWGTSRGQFNDGANDGFLIQHQQHGGGLEAIQYMVRDRVPVHNALADAYTSCDRWFSSVMGPTLPNRMYWHAGTANGAMNNDAVLGGAHEGVTSLYHRLEESGIDWAYYYGDVPVLSVLDDIPVEGHIRRFLYDFIDDAAAGRLPPIVYIDPGFGTNDDHPPHHPLLGQQLISAVYQALATSPQWNNVMLVVTYDEHGGFFDHVPPPKVPDENASIGFDQLGFRVPTIVAGPYAKQGYVSSVEYDHTSALRHLQNVFGFGTLGTRTDAANDLIDCIDLERLAAGQPAAPVTMPAVEIDEENLPERCTYGSVLNGGFEHDLLEWAEGANLGKLDLRHESRNYVYGIAEYLDYHNLGRIRPKK